MASNTYSFQAARRSNTRETGKSRLAERRRGRGLTSQHGRLLSGRPFLCKAKGSGNPLHYVMLMPVFDCLSHKQRVEVGNRTTCSNSLK